ncbi:doublesex- and mab-3-related transcription factor 1-like [Xiphias gladius]|uniref:doublesex- and mab-3-related transcription factor 1-like n=1 Tax=Xiphias gladius TaxID=8245 RepID=UPI001A980E5B|nr:doublesex- and mab-3-related transcription factor 1-like [Xiphias gladius]
MKMIHFTQSSAGGQRLWSSTGAQLAKTLRRNKVMSLSKEMAAAAEEPRRPKCTRCRHHGIIVPQKGHMKSCPFLKCDCWKCYLITQRTRITALQRNLKKAQSEPGDEEQRPRAPKAAGVRKPAAEGSAGAVAPGGGARPSATSGLTCPRPTGAPGSAATSAAGGEQVAGGESKEALPCPPYSAPYLDQRGQTPPLPVIPFPVRMSGHYPGSYAPCPNFLFNVPWLPPVPVGFYNNGLCGPRIFPHFLQGAVHYPPPPEPEPPAENREGFFSPRPPPLPEAFQEELMSRQHPQPPLPRHSEPDVEELE